MSTKGGPVFKFSLPGGRAPQHCPPVSYTTGGTPSTTAPLSRPL